VTNIACYSKLLRNRIFSLKWISHVEIAEKCFTSLPPSLSLSFSLWHSLFFLGVLSSSPLLLPLLLPSVEKRARRRTVPDKFALRLVGEKYDNLRIRDLGLAVYTSPPSFFLFLRGRRASFPFLSGPLRLRSHSSSRCQVKHGRPARAI